MAERLRGMMNGKGSVTWDMFDSALYDVGIYQTVDILHSESREFPIVLECGVTNSRAPTMRMLLNAKGTFYEFCSHGPLDQASLIEDIDSR